MADYPFTTLEPVLGTLERDDRQLVIADIPGLIEGASAGAGLGHEFLAHVERCRLLVHVLDLAPLDGSDPVANHATVEAELREHGARAGRPPAAPVPVEGRPRAARARRRAGGDEWRERLDAACRWSPPRPPPAQGLDELATRDLRGRCRRGGAASRGAGASTPATHRVYRPGRAATRSRGAHRARARSAWRASGVERLIARHDIENEEALRYVEERLRALGVIRALEAAGFEPGDDVEIAGIVFELDPGGAVR